MSTAHTTYEIQESLAVLTFNRPEARNAMTWEMYQALVDACDRVDADAGIRVLVLRGAGRGEDPVRAGGHHEVPKELQLLQRLSWMTEFLERDSSLPRREAARRRFKSARSSSGRRRVQPLLSANTDTDG